MRWRRAIRLADRRMRSVTVCMLGLLGLAHAGCGEETPVVVPLPLAASFDYRMPERFAIPDPPDPEGQYEIYVQGPLQPNQWFVVFEACASTGGVVEYRWSIDGTAAAVETECDAFFYPFGAEATYSVSLTVVDDEGEQDSQTIDVVVKDYLIFGLGDSYGSGEGNPDVRVDLGAGVPGGSENSAVWQNRRCHRSAHSGQVRAAQLLEESDPHTSVSFVHLACSGARVYRGLLEPYGGVEDAEDPQACPSGGGAPPFPPQIDRVEELAAGYEIDALVVSIGGNDVNFANIIEACIAGKDCDEPSVVFDPAFEAQAKQICALAGSYQDDCNEYFESFIPDPDTLYAVEIFDRHSITEDVITYDAQCNELSRVDIEQDGNDDLPDNYAAFADRIVNQLGMNPARVYLTEVPDIAHDEVGRLCGWDTAPTNSAALLQIPGVKRVEMDWASSYAAAELLITMQDAANLHGWQMVTGIANRFRLHGYCSVNGWLMRLHDSFLIQGDKFGAVHPNEAGHWAYAREIKDAIAP